MGWMRLNLKDEMKVETRMIVEMNEMKKIEPENKK